MFMSIKSILLSLRKSGNLLMLHQLVIRQNLIDNCKFNPKLPGNYTMLKDYEL